MSLSPVSQERLRIYGQFRHQLDLLNANEGAANEFLQFLSDRPPHSYWVSMPYWGDKITFKVELRKDEKLSEQGPLIEKFESLFGYVERTEDDVSEYSMSRRFYTPKAQLLIGVPGNSMTCKRVEVEATEEVVTHRKYKIECTEAA